LGGWSAGPPQNTQSFHDVAANFKHLAQSGNVDQELVDVCGVAASEL